jgi:hypothetical protein
MLRENVQRQGFNAEDAELTFDAEDAEAAEARRQAAFDL